MKRACPPGGVRAVKLGNGRLWWWRSIIIPNYLQVARTLLRESTIISQYSVATNTRTNPNATARCPQISCERPSDITAPPRAAGARGEKQGRGASASSGHDLAMTGLWSRFPDSSRDQISASGGEGPCRKMSPSRSSEVPLASSLRRHRTRGWGASKSMTTPFATVEFIRGTSTHGGCHPSTDIRVRAEHA